MKNFHNGFTIVELIVVLAIMGIVSLVIIPKLGMESFKQTADIDSFISNVRYAQHESMLTGNNWRIIVNESGNQYTIDNDSIDTNSLPEIPGSDNPVTVNTSISATLDEFYFDYLGRPVDAHGQTITSEIKITIDTEKVIIEPYSGGVYAQ